MKLTRRLAVTSGLAALVAGCGGGGSNRRDSKFHRYAGPRVTQIQVYKRQRVMYLLSGSRTLKTYQIGLGGAPAGPKRFEGDGRTPEGAYYIDRLNPNSSYHLSLGISYPNVNDVAYASAYGRSAGGDIFIHGENGKTRGRKDWTAGCIAVTDKEIEEIFSMVQVGTPIIIFP